MMIAPDLLRGRPTTVAVCAPPIRGRGVSAGRTKRHGARDALELALVRHLDVGDRGVGALDAGVVLDAGDCVRVLGIKVTRERELVAGEEVSASRRGRRSAVLGPSPVPGESGQAPVLLEQVLDLLLLARAGGVDAVEVMREIAAAFVKSPASPRR